MQTEATEPFDIAALLLAIYVAMLLLALWKAVKHRFSVYWTLVVNVLLLGAVSLLSPFYLPVPLLYWDLVTRVGGYLLLGGVLAVVAGYAAGAVRSYRGRQP